MNSYYEKCGAHSLLLRKLESKLATATLVDYYFDWDLLPKQCWNFPRDFHIHYILLVDETSPQKDIGRFH